jgi:hypothetical protein
LNKRAKQIIFNGEVSQRHEANALLTIPGTAVLVSRGVARSVAIACPDGCGEQLTVNLDRRAGPAWRFFNSDSGISLFPSVWRETGCKSHFIVWRSKIFWCDWQDELDEPMHEVVESTQTMITKEFVSFVAIADALDVVPWAVLSACGKLCRNGFAEAGTGDHQGQFRRKQERA